MKTNILAFVFLIFFVDPIQAQEKNYILVHGAWHGAWCWNKVVPILEQHQQNVLAIDLPGHGESKIDPSTVTFDDYVNSITKAANAIEGQVILVGHSMAGVVIAQAAEILGKEKVEQLVFLDAFMPLNGESVFSLAEKAGRLNAEKNISPQGPTINESLVISADQKTARLKPENLDYLFYNDCSAEDIAYAKEKLSSQPLICLATPVQVSEEVYGSIPKTYILCKNAKDLNKLSISTNVVCKKIIKLESSHSPFFSMPEKLTDILLSL